MQKLAAHFIGPSLHAPASSPLPPNAMTFVKTVWGRERGLTIGA
ncbi:hypothetical protein [Deinococcus sp. QL22]|nr:hypothetical protein [Deinococcus sp. QL22]